MSTLLHNANRLADAFIRWRRFVRHRPPILLVLGMHRSGTSFVSGILDEAGFSLGEDLVGASESNPGGHFESRRCIGINDLILQRFGGTWDNPPPAVRSSFQIRWRIREFLASFRDGKPISLKDPRLVLTHHIWEPFLKKTSAIICIRNPLAVAKSLHARDGLSVERGLELWEIYNRQLLVLTEHLPEAVWFNFDAIGESTDAIALACKHCGIDCSKELIQRHFVEEWRRQGTSPENLGKHQELHERLVAKWREASCPKL
jgi:hypothetical protein